VVTLQDIEVVVCEVMPSYQGLSGTLHHRYSNAEPTADLKLIKQGKGR